MTVTDKPAKPKRRWYQFSLRTLLLVMLVLGCGLGYERHKAVKYKAAIDAIKALRGEIRFDSNHPVRTAWMKLLLSDDSFGNVNHVYLSGAHITDARLIHLRALTQLESLTLDNTNVTDSGLAHLRRMTQLQTLLLCDRHVTDAGLLHLQELTRLQSLSLDRTQATDAGFIHLQGLTQLQWLSLDYTQVTDAGLVHFQGLKELRTLRLEGTQVTDTGRRELQRALPNYCHMSR